MRILSRHFLGKGTTVVYPHSNGFSGDGSRLYLAATDDSGATALREVDLLTLQSRDIASLGERARGETAVWHDVAALGGQIAAVFDNAGWILDVAQDSPSRWRKVYAAEEGSFLQGLPSLSADGSRLLLGQTFSEGAGSPARHYAVEVDTASGKAQVLFCKQWLANHFHYCPHDEQWIGFSREGPATEVMDRCWGWHAQLAPQGRCVFDQYACAQDPQRPLSVGHERWSLHATGALVVAYAVSPGGRRGLWEAFTDGRPAQLLWENNSVWHCNSDASGRILAIDTSGDWNCGIPGNEFGKDVERHLDADARRAPNASDVVVLDLQQRQALHVATVLRNRHPWHPHPALSADGQWLVYNDEAPENPGAWLVRLGAD